MTNAAFFGSKEFGLSTLSTLMAADPSIDWTIIHPDDTTDTRSCLDRFKALSHDTGTDFFMVSKPSEARELIRRSCFDVGFACGWYWIFNNDDLTMVRNGIYGLHNSLLPKYRGSSPLVWSIINGDTDAGSSLFKFDEGMDSGPVALQISTEVNIDDSIGDVLHRLHSLLIEALPTVWRDILAGDVSLIEQDYAAATFCGQRLADDGRINWTYPASVLHNFIRAQAPPYPGAFTMMDGIRIIITRASVFPGTYYCTPGQVLERNPDYVVIGCGSNTAICVLGASAQGTSSTTAREVFRSTRIRL